MSTRDLNQNRKRIQREVDRLERFAERQLASSYADALDDIRSTLSRLYERFSIEGELTKAEAARFLRLSNLEQEITGILQPYLTRNEQLLEELAEVSFDRSFYQNAWAIDQAAGVNLGWGQVNPEMVRAAVGLTDDAAALGEVLSEREARRHRRVLRDAFKNYTDDTRRWIGQTVTQGVIRGDSVSQLAKRLDNDALMHSRNSAMMIARTETGRAATVGSQIAYDRAQDRGARIRQVWDATLDSRTRPEHAQMDGRVRNEETGEFDAAWGGTTPGPKRSGIAAQDIQCRCTVRPEIEGYAPRVRRIRDEGVQPYQTFGDWARRNGITTNRFGQRYSFLEE